MKRTFLLLFLLSALFAAAQPVERDSLSWIIFAKNGLQKSMFPDLESKYGASIRKSTDFSQEYDPFRQTRVDTFLSIYVGNKLNAHIAFRIKLNLANHMVYDSIRVSQFPLYPYYKYQAPPSSSYYDTKSAVPKKRYNFTFQINGDLNYLFGGDTVLCRNCDGSSIDGYAVADLKSKVAGFSVSEVQVSRYDSTTTSTFYETTRSIQGGTDPNSPLVINSYGLCMSCAQYIATKENNSSLYFPVLNHCQQQISLFPLNEFYFQIYLRSEGLQVTGFRKGVATDLTDRILHPEDENIEAYFDLTGKELDKSEAKGLVIARYNNGRRQLLRIEK